MRIRFCCLGTAQLECCELKTQNDIADVTPGIRRLITPAEEHFRLGIIWCGANPAGRRRTEFGEFQ